MNLPTGQTKAFLEIALRIKKDLEEGQLKVGERLPAERTLANIFQTSRATVREALRALEIIGVIESRVGQGTFIRTKSFGSADIFTEITSETSPTEVFEARFSVEPYLSALAAWRATQENLNQMQVILNETTKCLGEMLFSPEQIHEFERLDGLFHHEIANAAKNSFLLRIVEIINAVRMEKLWGTLKQRSLTSVRMNKYYLEHLQIFSAIKERDAEKAEKLAYQHLKNVKNNMLGK